MIEKRHISTINDYGDVINADLRYASEGDLAAVVMVAHGFKGFKDWGFLPYVGERLAENGLISVVFNFSLNGNKNRTDLMIDVEDFRRNTITRQREDFVLLAERLGELMPAHIAKRWNSEIYLLGHSLGGGMCALVSKYIQNTRKIAVWGSISHFCRYTRHQMEEWRRQGTMEFPNARTGQIIAMDVGYLEDVVQNYPKNILATTLASVNLPLFVVHGLQDVTVNVREARALAEAVRPELRNELIIEKTGHTFGVTHPFIGPTPELDLALRTTIEFYIK